ncbi:hypothetical protein [Thiomonas sp. FB-Cd]|uniref:hypothetical protein n=1 Tax=Thiomonas sp. FB-Cd TaxID=1158292 RepID=UPI0012DF958E|nr:hypothetical protein [Thiomonas sp. FB-Cd]
MHSRNDMIKHAQLPEAFCWTKFGTESGEAIEDIVARKERERVANGGVFLWGIGNSVGPAVREFVRTTATPVVVFSPMRSKPKEIDVTPSSLLTWAGATTLDGDEWQIPSGSRVVSRDSSKGQRRKTTHYALVCRSREPLSLGAGMADIAYETLANFLSGTRLGHSQVTAVVRRVATDVASPTVYPAVFIAELVFPYFVRLHDPRSTTKPSSRATRRPVQASLLASA